MVLGGHGDQMVPVVSATTVGGIPLTQARLRRADRRDGRAHAQGRRRDRRSCSAPPPGTRRARPSRRWCDAVCLDQKRVLPCTALPRGRVRDRRPLHGRAGEARRGRHRGDRRARALRRGARRARASPPTPCARSSACSPGRAETPVFSRSPRSSRCSRRGGGLRLLPSNEYLFLPDTARPSTRSSTSPASTSTTGGGIYMVDISCARRACSSGYFPALHDGATLVPARVKNPAGVKRVQRSRASNR